MNTQTTTYQSYDSYKDSGVDWIGQIPDHWSVDYVTKYFSISKEKISEGVVDALSVGYMGVVPQLENAAKNNAEGDRKLVRPGDIAINSRSDRMGAAGLSIHKGGVSLVYHVLRPKGKYEGKYYHHVYRNNMFSQEFYRQGGGIVDDLWSTKDSRLVRIKLPNPSEEEKKQIASYIDAKVALIDELISKKQKLIELLQEKRQALITQAVTKGFDPKAKMKDSGVEWIGEMPDHWKSEKFKFHIDLISSKVTSDMDFKVSLENIESWTGRYISTHSEYSGIGIQFKKNDILFGKLRPYLAKVFLCKEIGEAGGDILVYRTHKSLLANYLFYLLSSYAFIDNIRNATYGARMPRTDSRFLGDCVIPLIPLPEQDAISNYLDEACVKFNKLVDRTYKQIEKLDEYKSVLIYNAVTGKIKVNYAK